MRRPLITATLITAFAAAAVAVTAQQGRQTGVGGGGSPHWRADVTVHGAAITIEYGRPFLKGRPESQLMPPGTPWRTGADQATIITSDKPLTFGAIKLSPGTYTINTEPGDKAWQLILGKLEKPGQWGVPYRPDLEIGRAPMTVGKTKAPVEQVTISIDQTPAGGTLRVEWGTASASIAFTIG